MSRPPRQPGTLPRLARVGGRARNVERRFLDVVDVLGGGTAGSFDSAAAAIATLRGAWRLGEASGTFADTSAHLPAAPLTAGGSGAYTRAVTGLIDASEDDGAVSFDVAGTGSSRLLSGSETSLFTGTASALTVVGWIKPHATISSDPAWRGGIFANSSIIAGSPSYESGWALECQWPGGLANPNLRFVRASNSGGVQAATVTGLTAGTGYMVAASYDGSTARVYVNASLQATLSDARVLGDVCGSPTIGHVSYTSGFSILDGPFYGTIDEVRFYSTVLTAAQLAALYTAGTTSPTTADTVPTVGDDGTTSFQFPTFEMLVDGA